MFPLIALCLAFLFLATVLYAGSSLASWYPTSSRDYNTIAKHAALKKGQTLLEIGCGDGRVCFELARRFPNSTIYGIELSYGLYVLCKLKAWAYGQRNVQFLFGNALKRNLASYDVIYVYGLPKTVNGPLKQMLLQTTKEAVRIISYTFEIKNWPGRAKKYPKQSEGWVYVYQKNSHPTK